MAEARGETPVAGQLSDACAYRLISSSAARQMSGSQGVQTHAHTEDSIGVPSRAHERGQFGAWLVFWNIELEEREVPSDRVDATIRPRKGLEKQRAYRGHSDGSREVPMVRTPADPLGSRTPSCGRSQRRDTGRGSHYRSAAHTCVKGINKPCKRQGNRRFPDG